MNLKDVHDGQKEVSAKVIFTPEGHSATAIQIMEEGLLKEHLTKIPALLVCIKGEAIYEDEKGRQVQLFSGDFHKIEPMVKHWVKGITTCQLLLVR